MFARRIGLAAIVLAALAPLTACKKKSDPGPTPDPGPGPGGWLVGDDGLMARVDADGNVDDRYGLGTAVDLSAIVCRGLTDAFVVGDAGTMLRTFDGGARWDAVDVGAVGDLRTVSADAHGLVVTAGDGPLYVSTDSGARWAAIGEARHYLTVAIGTGATLALDDGGVVWRVSPAGELAMLTTVPGARSIAFSHDGQYAAAVGTGGVLARSDDGARTWTSFAPDPALDLHAAWVGLDGTLIGVGAGGVVLRADATGVAVTHPVSATLRAIHLDASGWGLAGGDDGALLLLDDGGATATALDGALDGTIRGLDQIGRGHF